MHLYILTMSSKVKKNIGAIKDLSTVPRHIRAVIIDNGTRDLILALCEVIHNVLVGNVKLTPDEIGRLKRYKRTLVNIIDKKTSVKKKKVLIKQHGGFLMTLLPPALSVLASILSNVV